MGFESAGSRAWLLEAPRGRTRCAGTQTPTALLPCEWLTGSREGFPALHIVTSPVTAAIIKTLFKNSPYARWVGFFPPRNYPNTAAQPAQLHIKHGWLQCHFGSEMPPRSGCWRGAVPPCAHVPVPPRGSSAPQARGQGWRRAVGADPKRQLGAPGCSHWCCSITSFPLSSSFFLFSDTIWMMAICRCGNKQVATLPSLHTHHSSWKELPWAVLAARGTQQGRG